MPRWKEFECEVRELIWVWIVLTLCGGVTFFVGHLWEETAHLVHFFFDRDLNEHLGEKVKIAGATSFLAGLGLLYFFK